MPDELVDSAGDVSALDLGDPGTTTIWPPRSMTCRPTKDRPSPSPARRPNGEPRRPTPDDGPLEGPSLAPYPQAADADSD